MESPESLHAEQKLDSGAREEYVIILMG